MAKPQVTDEEVERVSFLRRLQDLAMKRVVDWLGRYPAQDQQPQPTRESSQSAQYKRQVRTTALDERSGRTETRSVSGPGLDKRAVARQRATSGISNENAKFTGRVPAPAPQPRRAAGIAMWNPDVPSVRPAVDTPEVAKPEPAKEVVGGIALRSPEPAPTAEPLGPKRNGIQKWQGPHVDSDLQKKALGKLLQFTVSGSATHATVAGLAGNKWHVKSSALHAMETQLYHDGPLAEMTGVDPTDNVEYYKVQHLPKAQLARALKEVQGDFGRGAQDMRLNHSFNDESKAAENPWALSTMLNAMLENGPTEGPFGKPNPDLREELLKNADEYAQAIVKDSPEAAKELREALNTVGRMNNAPELAKLAKDLSKTVGQALDQAKELDTGKAADRSTGNEL